MPHPPPSADPSARSLLKLGHLASLGCVLALPVALWIYLTGNLSDPGGRFVYALADLLYGPV